MEVSFDPVEVDTAIARDVGKAIDIFFSTESHLHYNRLNGLLDPVAADPGNNFRASLRLMLDDAIDGAVPVEQVT
jgi:hypothetical protein